MSVFDWRGASSVFAGEQEYAGRQLDGMTPQAAFYWRKKAGLTGTKDKPVRGWRDANYYKSSMAEPCYFSESGDRDRKAIKG